MQEILSINNLYVKYDKNCRENVLKDLSMTINDREIIGLIGESGCGKSTTAKSIMGLLKYSGDIKIYGKNIDSMTRKERAREVEMIFQNPYNSLDPRMKVKNILMEPFKIHHLYSPDERNSKVKRILNVIGFDEKILSRHVNELSGGQRQRVAIGAALILEPKLIIADEILSALDVSVQASIANLIIELKQKLGISFIFISHDINMVAYLCDRIAVMYCGQIVENGNAMDIYNNPLHPYTKNLLNSIASPYKKNNISVVTKKNNYSECKCAYSMSCPYFCEKFLNEKIDWCKVENGHNVLCNYYKED